MSTLVEHQTLIDDLIKIRYRNGKFGQNAGGILFCEITYRERHFVTLGRARTDHQGCVRRMWFLVIELTAVTYPGFYCGVYILTYNFGRAYPMKTFITP